MSTKRRIESSRANGAKSHGPVTPEGKRKSSGNSARHKLLTTVLVLKDEEEKTFNDLLDGLLREHNPQTDTQRLLVESMAAARWRLLRTWSLERATLDMEIDKQDHIAHPPENTAALAFRALADQSRALDLIHRYEVRFERQFARSLNLLLKLQQSCQTNLTSGAGLPACAGGIGLPACPTAEGGTEASPEATPTQPDPEVTSEPSPISRLAPPTQSQDFPLSPKYPLTYLPPTG